jgi:hypothetical protein
MDTIFAFDKEAEVLYHVTLVRVVPPKILLDGGDKLMNDARYKLFARCCCSAIVELLQDGEVPPVVQSQR